MKTLKIRDTRIAEPRMSSARESISEALQRYESLRPTYEGFSGLVRQILTDKLRERAVRIHSIEARVKSAESVERKILRMFEPKRASYAVEDLLRWVTDLAAVRVITFFPRTVSEIDAIIRERFFVLEKDNKSESRAASGSFGYRSVHYLVELAPEHLDRSDRRWFQGLVAEIQVRTILQHAWAEIEHDIQYKSVRAIPAAIRRRLAAVAGLLEIADREFQAIQDEEERSLRSVSV